LGSGEEKIVQHILEQSNEHGGMKKVVNGGTERGEKKKHAPQAVQHEEKGREEKRELLLSKKDR